MTKAQTAQIRATWDAQGHSQGYCWHLNMEMEQSEAGHGYLMGNFTAPTAVNTCSRKIEVVSLPRSDLSLASAQQTPAPPGSLSPSPRPSCASFENTHTRRIAWLTPTRFDVQAESEPVPERLAYWGLGPNPLTPRSLGDQARRDPSPRNQFFENERGQAPIVHPMLLRSGSQGRNASG
jgi:hypothetical protein